MNRRPLLPPSLKPDATSTLPPVPVRAYPPWTTVEPPLSKGLPPCEAPPTKLTECASETNNVLSICGPANIYLTTNSPEPPSPPSILKRFDPSPPSRRISPPTEASSLVLPAMTRTPPPSPACPAATFREMSPPAPVRASPEPRVIVPEFPVLEEPEERLICPDEPVAPEFGVLIDMCPEEVSTLEP